MPATWQTVASTGADAPLTLAARGGRPVLHVASGWTYGPASGVATTTAASDRAAYIHEGATLAIDANGGTATFEDPVAGPGKLEIASGTLSVPGGISSETSLKVASGATFAWSAATAVAGLEAASGATLRVVDATKPLAVAGAVDLTGVTIDVTGAGDGRGYADGWQRAPDSFGGSDRRPADGRRRAGHCAGRDRIGRHGDA